MGLTIKTHRYEGNYRGKCCMCPRPVGDFSYRDLDGDHVLICERCLSYIRRPPIVTVDYVYPNGVKHALVSAKEFAKARGILESNGRWDEIIAKIVADKMSGHDYTKGGA